MVDELAVGCVVGVLGGVLGAAVGGALAGMMGTACAWALGGVTVATLAMVAWLIICSICAGAIGAAQYTVWGKNRDQVQFPADS